MGKLAIVDSIPKTLAGKLLRRVLVERSSRSGRRINAVVNLSQSEFSLVLGMAAAGRMVSVHVSFQEPRYGSALIASCSFSSDPPEM